MDLRSALARLRAAIDRSRAETDDVARDSVIKRFEFTFELAWKAMRDWLRVWEQDIQPSSPRQVLEAGVARGLIVDANNWSAMLFYRNRTVHIYNEVEVDLIARWVAVAGLEMFDALVIRLDQGR